MPPSIGPVQNNDGTIIKTGPENSFPVTSRHPISTVCSIISRDQTSLTVCTGYRKQEKIELLWRDLLKMPSQVFHILLDPIVIYHRTGSVSIALPAILNCQVQTPILRLTNTIALSRMTLLNMNRLKNTRATEKDSIIQRACRGCLIILTSGAGDGSLIRGEP